MDWIGILLWLSALWFVGLCVYGFYIWRQFRKAITSDCTEGD